jgi:hypothetical protein
MKLALVTKQDGYIEYDDEILEQSGIEECLIASDYFDLYMFDYDDDVEKLQRAVVIGKVYIGEDIPDGRYISAGGDETYVLGGRVVTEREFVGAKLGRRGLRALDDDDPELKDMLDPWTW